MTDPIPTDFWGVVVPTWASAIGTIGASVIAVIALFTGRSARRGVQNVGSGLNAEAEHTAEEAADDIADRQAEEARSRAVEADVNDMAARIKDALSESRSSGARVRWQLFAQSKSRHGLLNDSGTTASVKAVEDVSDGHRDALSLLTQLPVDIGPGASLLFSIDRSLASPAVTAVEVTWTEGDNGRIRRQVFYV